MERAVGNYVQQLCCVLGDVEWRQVAIFIEHLKHAARHGYKIFVAGNGGSAATADHMVVDLLKHARVPAVSLLTPSVMTAYANDTHYREIFKAQVEQLVRWGDALVLFSASGRSPNVVEAAQAASKAGAVVFAVTGGKDSLNTNALIHVSDHCIIVPTDDVQHIEDVHLVLVHIIANGVRS